MFQDRSHAQSRDGSSGFTTECTLVALTASAQELDSAIDHLIDSLIGRPCVFGRGFFRHHGRCDHARNARYGSEQQPHSGRGESASGRSRDPIQLHVGFPTKVEM